MIVSLVTVQQNKTGRKVRPGNRRKCIKESNDYDLDGPLQCYRCGENFDSIPSVKSHMTEKHRICRKSHYGKPRHHQCHVCKGRFYSEGSVKKPSPNK